MGLFSTCIHTSNKIWQYSFLIFLQQNVFTEVISVLKNAESDYGINQYIHELY